MSRMYVSSVCACSSPCCLLAAALLRPRWTSQSWPFDTFGVDMSELSRPLQKGLVRNVQVSMRTLIMGGWPMSIVACSTCVWRIPRLLEWRGRSWEEGE